jgi:hypothetical protein
MSTQHRIIPTLAITAAALLLGACGNDAGMDTPAESAGENLEQAAEETREALDRAAEETGDAIEDAGEKVESATD